MFKNRFTLIAAMLFAVLVSLALANPFAIAPSSEELSRPPRPVILPVTGVDARSYIMDSATRSYIAWGEALEKAKLNALDSGTRSYIAWGQALEAAGKLGESDTCSSTTQENILAGIPNNVDSATRSYIAWGLALQAKDDIRACR